MKILYFSDTYAYGVMGTKRSIYEELVRRGNTVMFQDKKKIRKILGISNFYKPDQIWLAHSGLVIPKGTKKGIKAPIIGFGFSDPNYFSEERMENYDAYITYHYETYLYLKAKFGIPILYNPSACDFRFHKKIEVKKDIDISCIGLGRHPRFKNQLERIEIVNKLRKETTFNIHAYGRSWPTHSKNFSHVGGDKFLDIINRSKIGLDIQSVEMNPAHRMFEYLACGTPIITRNRPEIKRVFEPNKEILVYDSYDDLKEKLIYYLGNPEKLNQIGLNARKRCVKEHDIKNRVDTIFAFLKKEIK